MNCAGQATAAKKKFMVNAWASSSNRSLQDAVWDVPSQDSLG